MCVCVRHGTNGHVVCACVCLRVRVSDTEGQQMLLLECGGGLGPNVKTGSSVV